MKKLFNKINWQPVFTLFGIFVVLSLTFFVIFTQNKKLEAVVRENIMLQTTIDSCMQSNQEEHITNTRYEITLEIFREVNPKGAEQFEQIMSHRTE